MIDESGDTGFKFEKGSSRYFVVALVIFKDRLDAEETSLKIKKLKRRLGWGEASEFKFSKTKNKFRRELFETIRNCPFRFKVVVIDKTKFAKERLRERRFYDYVFGRSFNNLKELKGSAVLYFDKMADKKFILSFTDEPD